MIYKSIIENLEKEISEEIEKGYIPGISVVLLTKDDVIWSKGFGHTDHSRNQEVDENTLLGLQSSTKTFTAIAFLRAVQKGLVELDDPIIKVYPEFTVKNRFEENEVQKITFTHLLRHSAGLGSETILGGCFGPTNVTFDEHVHSIANTWLEYPVGTRSAYSNISMDLIAYGLQKITNKSYPEYFKEEVANPLGIKSYALESDEAYRNPNCFKGFVGDHEPVFDNLNSYGCGSLFMTSSDLVKFVQMLLNRGKTTEGIQFLEPELYENLLSGEPGEYGLGVSINSIGDAMVYDHAGGGFGYASKMTWIPDYNFGIIIQSNQEYTGFVGEIHDKAIQAVLEAKGALKEQVSDVLQRDLIDVEQDHLTKLAGRYAGHMGTVLVKMLDGKLYLNFWNTDRELKPIGKGEFYEDNVNDVGYVKFEVGNNWEPQRIKFSIKGYGYVIYSYLSKEETETQTKIKDEWKIYTGLYRMFFYGIEASHFSVGIRDGHLWVGNQRLTEYRDNLFLTSTGQMVEFYDGYMYKSSQKATKIVNPVQELTDLAESDPSHRFLKEFVLGEVIHSLKQLNRDEEAIKIEELKKSSE
ncbi:MAG: serine hydrolase domain-containing protein [Candidatus Kariarchaeaceae archaeon]|jgi:CubicO group peptidase (beta-lactamase class C family)